MAESTKLYKVLKLTYKDELTEHDGYCSDPYDLEITEESESIYYVSLNHFKDLNKKNIGSIDINNEELKTYKEFHQGCGLGSSYCGLGLVKYLKSAEIVMSEQKGNNFKIVKVLNENALLYHNGSVVL